MREKKTYSFSNKNNFRLKNINWKMGTNKTNWKGQILPLYTEYNVAKYIPNKFKYTHANNGAK